MPPRLPPPPAPGHGKPHPHRPQRPATSVRTETRWVMTRLAASGHGVRLMRRISRLWRELRPDRNPLRRACDRAEAALLAVLLAVFLVAVSLAAVIVGGRA